MSKSDKSIIIVGAGLVGSLMAVLLAKRGYAVKIFEKRSDLRRKDISAGRSINLALSDRGIKALTLAGLSEKINSMVIPMAGRMMHDVVGNLTFQPYGKEGQAINSISRGGLNAMLMDQAESLGVEIAFDSKCTHVDFAKTEINFENQGQTIQETPDVILACDGAFSAVRSELQKQDRFNYSQHYIEHGYKELHIPQLKEGGFALEKGALHIWPRGHFMLIALPNLDESFTVTLFLPFEGKPSFDSLKTDEDIQNFFNTTFADIMPVSPGVLEDFKSNPTSSLVTVKCYPWAKNNTLLLGDSSHAIVPFYGQGMNSGFEDCTVLWNMLEEYNDDWDKVLAQYQSARKPDADAIADLALRNFVEMRDSVGNPQFLKRKQIEAQLHAKYPDRWIPLYSMVTFSHTPYSEALAIGIQQDKIMAQVMSKYGLEVALEDIDYEWIMSLV